jgi:hypothetical protein
MPHSITDHIIELKLKKLYHKDKASIEACVIYSNYRYLIRRNKPLPIVKEKMRQEDVRKFFEALRALEL